MLGVPRLRCHSPCSRIASDADSDGALPTQRRSYLAASLRSLLPPAYIVNFKRIVITGPSVYTS